MQFSRPLLNFRELSLPEENATLAGYAALMDAYQLELPLPRRLCIISAHHKMSNQDKWKIKSTQVGEQALEEFFNP